ncbi:MFS transporter, partial [Francisella tularensis subsp. holarctica]|nr:MFS transporter [Francisella tularensis subsp. holarctica]
MSIILRFLKYIFSYTMQKVTKAVFIIWFICAFFYALEFIIRATGHSLYNDFSIAPYNLSPEQ